VFTGNVLLQFIGNRSYSIYLWHWPLVVTLVYFELSQDYLWITAGMLASVLFGHLSYTCIELPAQNSLAATSRWRAAFMLIGILAAISVMAQEIRRSGFPERISEQLVRIEKEAWPDDGKPICADPMSCIFGGSDVQAIILGDSHASAMRAAVEKALPKTTQGVFLRASAGCAIIFGAEPTGKVEVDKCVAMLHELEASIDTLYPGKPVIVISRAALFVEGESDSTYAKGKPRPWVKFSEQLEAATPPFREQYRRAYIDTACKLAKKHPLYLMRPLPEFPAPVPQIMGRSMMRGGEPIARMAVKKYFERQSYIWSIQDAAAQDCGAHILNPLPYMCDDTYCYGSHKGNAIYFDTDHVGRYGVELLSPMFDEVFQ
jgi:hypothetical protein